jgi:hypothetical protein
MDRDGGPLEHRQTGYKTHNQNQIFKTTTPALVRTGQSPADFARE